jgi:hypothetical protein
LSGKRRTAVDPVELAQEWLRGVRIRDVAHNLAAARYDRIGQLLGIPVVIFATFVATASFSALSGSPVRWVQIAAGAVSVVAAVLAGLQTFLRYPELSQKHKSAAGKCGEIRRAIEESLTLEPPALQERLKPLRQRMDTVYDESPVIPQSIYGKAKRWVEASRDAGD